MSTRRQLQPHVLILPALVVLLLLWGTGSALAADTSTTYRTVDDRDNIVDFDSAYPRDCWSFFDTIYYKDDVWEAFTKKDDKDALDNEIAVYVSHAPAGGEAPSQPTHYRVVEDGQTWDWSDYYGDGRRPNAARFAVFKGMLFLYVAKTYDENTGAILYQKQIDPIAAEYVDGTRWNPPAVKIWEHRPNDPDHPQVIRGLVVKVINDTLYILLQYSNTKDLYLITSTDGETFSGGETPVYTFAGKDCLQNGDVVTRDADSAALIAFVTKDDAFGGDSTTGTCKLWTIDPAKKTVAEVATLPNKYKELTIASGDVAGCEQDVAQGEPKYGTTALQLWGIGWDTDSVYHAQFVFNTVGTGGSFNPSARVDTGADASAHIENDSRNRLASCIAPEPVVETLAGGDTQVTSLQQYARVWWWGSTDSSGDNAHGRSMKYRMDFLRNLGTDKTATSGKDEIQDSWVLLGVVSGLPPYYPNDTDAGHLADNYALRWGTSQTYSFTSTIESERTFSMSYKSEGFLDIPLSSVGFSYSNAVQEKEEKTAESTISQTLTFSPAYGSADRAWGIFLTPEICTEKYHLLGPDKTTDFDVELYYTYYGAGSSLKSKEYDNVDAAPAGTFWADVKKYPSSMEYWNDLWNTGYTEIPESTDTYDGWSKDFLSESSKTEVTWSNSDTLLRSQSARNTVGVTAGAFGFETGMEGSLTIGSSSQTVIGTNLGLTYAVPAYAIPQRQKDEPVDYDYYLHTLGLKMYMLQAKTEDAFWIPYGVKTEYTQSLPWCITWHVNSYENVLTGWDQTTGSGHLLRGADEIAPGLRTALLAKVQALKAAYDRGDKKTALNILNALINQVKAQAGKGIPQGTADRWVSMYESLAPRFR